MKIIRFLLILFLAGNIASCSCNPEKVLKFAFKGMNAVMGEGFLPSEEIRALGDFKGMSVNLSVNKTEGISESTIFLKLEDGDPVLIGNQPEILARKCAEIYLRDFKNSDNYQQITIQFIQNDPMNPDNFAMQEFIFNTEDF